MDGLRDPPPSSEAASLQRVFSPQPLCRALRGPGRELCVRPTVASLSGWLFRAPLGLGPRVLRTGPAAGASRSALGRQDHPHPRHAPVCSPCPSRPGRLPALWQPVGVEDGAGGHVAAPEQSPAHTPEASSSPQQERPGSAPWPGPGGGSRDEARPRERPPWAGTVQQRQGHALQWRRLEHKLLAAVSPWVGEAGLLCTRPRPAVRPRRGTARGPGRGRGRGQGPALPGRVEGQGPAHPVWTCRALVLPPPRAPSCSARGGQSRKGPEAHPGVPSAQAPTEGAYAPGGGGLGAQERLSVTACQPALGALTPFVVECRGRWRGVSGWPCSCARVLSADGIRKQLQGAHLASTPVFALFIQVRSA